MMKKLLLLLLTFASCTAFAQINFEDGYYIDNSGERVQVQIKNVEWKNNPTEITYRHSEAGNPQTKGTEEVSEFGINDDVHYVRATVPVDQSSPNLRSLSNHGRFESKEETIFLKLLVDGEADLLQLQRGNLQQFFLRTNQGDIEPLFYKRYVPPKTVKIAENKQYQQQLLNALSCENIGPGDVTKTDYKRTDLVKLFTKYNNCMNSDFRDLTASANERDAFNLRIRPGVNFASMRLSTHVVQRTMEFGDKTTFRLGLEGEYILPFFKNKWGFIIEPTYQYYEGETIFPEVRPLPDGTVSVKYQSVELPFGVRHYFFLNENQQIFVNATYTVDFVIGDSHYDYETVADYPDTQFDSNSGTNFSFGAGYNYRKFQVEARYNAEREVGISGTGYQTFSLIFGYNFL